MPPPPLVDRERRLIVLWSPKSACTAVYVWFASVCGFLDEVRQYESPHHHRMQVFRTSQRYHDSVAGDTSDFHVVKIIRDPYVRAASIFREALVGTYADRDAALAGLSFDAGVSFYMFLLMVERLDMETVDTHYRPQFHPFERMRHPDTVINISRMDLYAQLNAFERRKGWAQTDFGSMQWFHDQECARRARPNSLSGSPAYKTPIARGSPPAQTPFPDYKSFLTPDAKRRIEAIYRTDFEAYNGIL